ncbi:MAG: leucine-rich repeat protein, partial [Alphaproteobacteria bacterium]|nr:leucine-rich repeat protein [Alphaproteobacteria bacterium]
SRIEDLDRLFAAHPELTLVIAFKDEVTEVGDRFCGRKDLFQPHKFSTKVQNISFSGKNLIKIGYRFFLGCPFIQAVDFRGLRALESVGGLFFMGAERITTLDLGGLTALVNIGACFFCDAESLQFLDTRGLGAVREIGSSFFDGASQLTCADLSYLKRLKGIGDMFLADVPIQEIDISDMTKLERIGGFFLYHTHALESVKFGRLDNLKFIEHHFLVSCSQLKCLNLSGCINLQSVGNEFLCETDALESVNFGRLENLTFIGDNFLASCSSLKWLNLSGCPNLERIGSGFLKYANPEIEIYCHDESIKSLMRKAMV